MSDAEYSSLLAWMRDGGKVEPIVLHENKVLDGRHRLRAHLELGTRPRFIKFDPAWGDPIEWVIGVNSHRSKSDGQRAYEAAKFMSDLARLRRKSAADLDGRASELAATRFGVSPRQVEYARVLMKRAPKLFGKLGTDRTYNVNRAMQEHNRHLRARLHRSAVAAAPADMHNCDLRLGDVVERLEEIPSKSVRVIFGDSPYNLKKHYHGDKSGDARTDAEFLAWCRAWLAGCARVLAADGSLFVMMNNRYAGRLESILRELGLHWRNTIYWWENNPENQRGNFSDAVRQILYFTRDRNSFVWNDDVRVDSRRNAIGDKRGLDAGKIPDNVWIDCRIPGNSGERVPFRDAPPQLPVAIPERCILIASEPGDTILDPFNGNGTTAVAALTHGRRYIGIDRSRKYLEQSRRWISAQLAAAANAKSEAA
jgi:DNA modification methylase